ncbi:hypothetical protein ACFWP0_17465 [Achromobacter sp. NPDC058515]|uniref:hypothetical protein n=1 Tax=Achromobacter sp. NPDC058515 TaxID=3346533 RepID=UPI003653BC34
MNDQQEPAFSQRETQPAAAAPSHPQDADAARPRRPGWLLKTATCLVYAAMLAWSVHSARPSSLPDIAALAVASAAGLAVVPLVALAFLSLWKRFRTPRNRLRIALAAGLFLMFAVAPEIARRNDEKIQRDVANAEIRKTADALRLMLGGAHATPDAASSIDPTPKATGPYGEMERALKTVARERLAQHKAYVQELKEIGLPRLFDAHRLARDAGLIESRLILEQAERLVPTYRKQSMQVLTQMPARIRALPIDEQEKANLLDSLAASNAAGSANLTRVWDLEGQILREFGQMITLLDDNRQFWYADHDELMFGRDDDLRRFRQHQDAVSRMVGEQDQLGRQPLPGVLRSSLR